jgi:hypothetical protein
MTARNLFRLTLAAGLAMALAACSMGGGAPLS